MFETSVQEKPSGPPWGIIAGCITLVGLLARGYFLATSGG